MGDVNARSLKSDSEIGLPAAYLWVVIGSALFIVALGVSAFVVPQLRILHLLQSFIDVAVSIFARRKNVYALGAGFTIAVAWNCLEIFVAHLMQAGTVMFWNFLHTGQVEHLETMMVPLGGMGHFILVIACLVLFIQATDKNKWWKFLSGGVLVLGYFAAIIAIARPR